MHLRCNAGAPVHACVRVRDRAGLRVACAVLFAGREEMTMRTMILTGLCMAAAGCSDGDRNAPHGGREVDTSPHLAAKSCDMPKGNNMPDTAKVGGTLGAIEVCWIYSDGTVRIELDATPKAKLFVDGVAQIVPADGRAIVTVDLDAALLRAPVASAIGDGAGITSPAVALKLEPVAGAKPIEGKLEIALGDAAADRTRALLAAVATGAVLPRTDLGPTPPAIDHGSLVLIPATEYTAMKSVGKATTLGQLDLVAVVRDGARHPAADCGPYDNFGMLPHALVDSTVTVFEASTGKKVVEQTFDSGHEGCSMFVSGYAGQKPTVESRPEERVVTDYLARLTAERAAS
jgi:hypothetical protein